MSNMCVCESFLIDKLHVDVTFIYYILPTSRKETPILAWDEVEAHIDPGQYGPRYGNDLVVIQ